MILDYAPGEFLLLAFLHLEKRPHFNYACIHHFSTFQKRDSLDSKILSQNYWNSNQIRDCVRNKFHQDLCTFSAKFLRQEIRFCKIFNLLILECMLSTVHRGLKSATQSKIFPSARTADQTFDCFDVKQYFFLQLYVPHRKSIPCTF